MVFDLLLKNGEVIDGTGAPRKKADVGIMGQRVSLLGPGDGATARRVIDAQGLAVCPGFVDLHTHNDFLLPLKDHDVVIEPFVRQGITTMATGNCGLAPAPLNPSTQSLLQGYTEFLMDKPLTWDWVTMRDFLDTLGDDGVIVNCAQFCAHGALRIAAMGMEGRTPIEVELEHMCELAKESIQAGVFGFSNGLMYPPGMYAHTDEIIEISSLFHDSGGVITSHIRGYSDTMLDAINELIRVGEEARVRVQLSHLGAFGRRHWLKVYDAMETVEKAQERGVDIHFDIVPWVAGNTSLAAIFPPFAVEGGIQRLMERLDDPVLRRQIRSEVLNYVPQWPPWEEGGGWSDNLSKSFGWENIIILSMGTNKSSLLIGKSLVQIGEEWDMEPFDVAVRLLEQENGNVFCAFVGLTGDFERQDIIQDMLVHPLCVIITDAISQRDGIPMPSLYGTFPRLLGHYARDLQALSLEEAVRKITSLPADIIGLQDRGVLKEGAFADVTIVNPHTVQGTSAYFQEKPEFPRGIEYVIVNGQVIFEKDVLHSDKRTGMVLRKF
jgi:N-acyl-D-aspartate/D-glutamate deacylase